MKRIISCLLFVAALTSAKAAVAADYNPWAIGGGVGQSFPTGPSTFYGAEDHKIHGSVWLRYHIAQPFGLELNYNRIAFRRGEAGAPSTNINGYTLNAFYQVWFTQRLSAIAAVGIGAGDIHDYGPSSYQELNLLARYGLEYAICHDLSVGAHAQFNYFSQMSSRAPSEIHSIGYLVSLTWAFGGEHAKAQPAPQAPVAEKPAVPEAKPDLDSDGDGVPDRLDKCPNTPKGAKVNKYGCQINEQAEVKLDVEFATGKATLSDDQKPQVKELADFMKENPKTHVVIAGHTDKTGSEAKNKRLSKARAETVRNLLEKEFGIDADRLRAEGFGSSKPVQSNDTEEGRKANRRVVTQITEKQ